MLTKKEFEAFRKELEKVTEGLAQKYNVNIQAGKIKYTSDSFTLNLEVAKKEVNGKSFEQAEFEKLCFLFDFEPADYNKRFSSGNKSFTIYGFNPKAKTMPVLAKNNEGKCYKFGTWVKKLIA